MSSQPTGGDPLAKPDVPDLSTIPEALWVIAREREVAIRQLFDAPGYTKSDVQKAAKRLRISSRSLYRLIASYRTDPQLTSLLPPRSACQPRARRLSPTYETIIEAAITETVKNAPRVKIADICRAVNMRCKESGLQAVSRKAISKRVADLKPHFVDRRKRITALGYSKPHHPGNFAAAAPLEVVQIDHTLADIIIVDALFREPVGRPWLTLAIDVASRVILGLHISLDPPSATSVSLCLSQACLQKEHWIAERQINCSWPVDGLPQRLHLDNGKEFHSEALRRGCEQYGIAIEYRPVRRPHFGGHIERLIGTLMGSVHLLPGTTFSNVEERGKYDSDKHAVLTLKEFEAWLCIEICEKYHRSVHRGLGQTPLSAWEQLNATTPTMSTKVIDPNRFLLDFLPLQRRTVRRSGVHLFNIRYWHDCLASLVGTGKRYVVRYDPRNLARVFLFAPDGHYYALPYADLRNVPITLWEYRSAVTRLRRKGDDASNERLIFAAIDRQREWVKAAAQKTKQARRLQERQQLALKEGQQIVREVGSRPSSAVDYSRPVQPYDFEEWS